jgi:CheY-like chemotaxis protein
MEKETKLILWIEDEYNYNEPYVVALKAVGYVVKFIDDINESIAYFSQRKNDIQLAIIDVMMPLPDKLIPEFNRNNAMSGLRTGEEVLRLLNAIADNKKVPKIFFTNVNAADFHLKYKDSPLVCGTYKKKETNVDGLVKIVNENVKQVIPC